MFLKKITAFLLSAFMLISLSACGDNAVVDDVAEVTSGEIIEEEADEITAAVIQTVPSDLSEEVSVTTELSTVVQISETSLKNLSEWTKAEIVEAYKNAAIKSASGVESKHAVAITQISINGEELGKPFDFIKKIISTFISNNSEDSQGITGGYKNLTESDVQSAKIYSSGKNTAIEMVMYEQTDGAKGDIHSGSVGHAIDVVGDIGVVTDELTELGLPIEISKENTTIHYTNPFLRVLLDGNGKIIKGTWSYTVEIRLKNYKAFGADVESSSIVMDNVITVNGGF